MWVISIYTSLWKSCQDNNKKIPTLINQLYFQVPVYYVILILRAESILRSDLLLYVALFWCMWQCKLTNNFFRLQVFSKSTLSGVLSECKVKHIIERMALQAHSNLFSHFFFHSHVIPPFSPCHKHILLLPFIHHEPFNMVFPQQTCLSDS